MWGLRSLYTTFLYFCDPIFLKTLTASTFLSSTITFSSGNHLDTNFCMFCLYSFLFFGPMLSKCVMATKGVGKP